jgi:hypothetical protein
MVGVPFGLIDLRSEAQFASALKSDTPTYRTRIAIRSVWRTDARNSD